MTTPHTHNISIMDGDNSQDADMSEISTASHNITQIIESIDEIAFLTDMLAFSATRARIHDSRRSESNEAVSDEVRSLVDRSMALARETADKIESILRQNREGHEGQQSGVNARVARDGACLLLPIPLKPAAS
jgi:methyl-accepting chemotaxis protein